MYIKSKEIELITADLDSALSLPFVSGGICAGTGFPSPAEDYLQDVLDLNKHVIVNPEATFFAKVKGVSMIDAGIYPDDILIIDRSLKPVDEDIVVAYLDGEFTLKRIKIENEKVFLMPESALFKPIEVQSGSTLIVWGVVTYWLKKTRRKNVRNSRLQ